MVSWWHSLWGYDPLSEILAETLHLGVKYYRFVINGGDADKVEWDKDEFSIDPGHDEFITSLADNGIQLTYNLVFWDIDTWPGGEGAPCPRFKTEEDIQHYLDYVRFVVNHFKDRVQYYEIWNEPDVTLCPQWIEPQDYIELVRRTVPVIRQEYPDAKIVIGSTTGPGTYLFKVIDSDVVALVDVISWHPFYGDSPEQNSNYYYAYPSIVQQIKDTASSHGFVGEYEGVEISYRPHSDPENEPNRRSYGEVAYAKYWARGILMNLGLDVRAGVLRVPHQYTEATQVVRNLSTIMAGASSGDLPVEIQTEAPITASYSFTTSDGGYLIALWDDGIAEDHDAGTPSRLVIPEYAGWNVTAIDVLFGFEQEMITETDDGNLVIAGLLIKDYPIILRLSP